ncbi:MULTISPECIES: anthrax toxin-like adenylyl cyclase domain-containing protein [Burkholderia]|uniref:anthrax toxin-like adenylyl cyclase domain-containing protein n=1 Tax=Burkholderia TaxID=32008 RepID=UPI000A48DCC3|nr:MULTISPECIES: anthrax toxin-like adenylyl cyclase domain-containing protein [Burkholderia]
MQRVAREHACQTCLIGIRRADRFATGRIESGRPAKGGRIKGKRANRGPPAG